MKKEIGIVIITLLAILLIWTQRDRFGFGKSRPQTRFSIAQDQSERQNSNARAAVPSETPFEKKTSLPPGPAPSGLEQMSVLLRHSLQPQTRYEDIVSLLTSNGQQPVVTRNQNSATGEMLIIRTTSPLPGTRYFHAQYFKDENNQRFVQHMSFEIKPSPTAFTDAIRLSQKSFSLGAPTEQTADFAKWVLNDDYILWVKKKSAHDLTNDAFNATDPVHDVGTVQIAVEMEIHDGDETHAH